MAGLGHPTSAQTTQQNLNSEKATKSCQYPILNDFHYTLWPCMFSAFQQPTKEEKKKEEDDQEKKKRDKEK